MSRVSAILLAAGSGRRLGGSVRKAMRPLAGRPMVEWSIAALAALDEVEEIVLVVHERDLPDAPGLAESGNGKVRALVCGGAERFDSVLAACRALPGPSDLVLVHDAARPLVGTREVRAAIKAAARVGGAILAVPEPDTLKRVDGGERVVETIPRDDVRRAQTPQVFRREAFVEAMERAAARGDRPTDDAAVFESAGHSVVAVAGDETNFKVTTPLDFAVAERILAERILAERQRGRA